ncbi:SPOR domain-containing protein [Marispirochaeta aestuarii]|uniref:SPOR domain-containing protein n=1 Tax=Marispirochaeta aestuarii TaxID=1963862 RepID=UPI002ABE1840|nr:SPOR domain-containing protein [Marispirochaeta aestuarii]
MTRTTAKVLIFSILFSLISFSLFSQSEWEGTTAMGRYGEFPSSGLYGASNSFPRNTLVEVENLETGMSATVLIVDRLDDPGLFLLLSREAAENLGIEDDQIVRSRVQLADNSRRLSIEDKDRPYHPDPDINPGAEDELSFLDRYAATEAEPGTAPVPPAALALVPPEPEETGDTEESPARPEPEAAAEAPPAVVADIAVEPEPEPEAPELTETAELDEGPRIEELVATAPEEDVPDLPLAEPELKDQAVAMGITDNLYGAAPGEEELALGELPVPSEAAEREAAIAEQFPLPQPPYNGEEESFVAAVPRLIEEPRLEAEEEPAEEEIAAAPAEEPQGETVVVLEPAEARPPEPSEGEESKALVQAEKEEVETLEVPTALQVEPDSLYLQLGVYTSPVSAESTAARFKGTYPVLVLNQDNAYYKVLVGPLSPDESGALLMNFRARGFRDAFIRKGY